MASTGLMSERLLLSLAQCLISLPEAKSHSILQGTIIYCLNWLIFDSEKELC